MAGHADNIHKLTIARLDSGDAAILVSATGARTFTLKVLTQKIKTIKIEIFIIVVIIVLPINITIKMKMIMVVIRARWQEWALQAVASLLMQGDHRCVSTLLANMYPYSHVGAHRHIQDYMHIHWHI